MEHMIKYKDNDMHLPYAILITKIMSHYGVDLSIDAAIDLGWHHCFYKKTLKKLNVVNVDGVWQHGRVNQDHGQNAEDEDQPMPEEHVSAQCIQESMTLKKDLMTFTNLFNKAAALHTQPRPTLTAPYPHPALHPHPASPSLARSGLVSTVAHPHPLHVALPAQIFQIHCNRFR
ncbi:hypothetical protein Fmac_014846 [Flemingia macrophylla]|uniref:Uncharacterized protein n=1 Tax=Flemingia macrophylla TaxID=520843 RepID=A0ABD1MDP1_9FABA